ncbi:unnamed protein product [Coffea canephora]|uniref:DUF3511 domain-containing protein n=1 Tax=Coffea canephora TaxID=49390 RepID=A0A068U4B4_COFCA|nr:unnamed protein product [Coffea canephora]
MEEFRSKSYHDGRNSQLESYSYSSNSNPSSNPTGLQDLRCYSASYATAANNGHTEISKDVKFKKGKSANGSISKSWSFNDPELQRKKRVASYKVYTVEGKVKGSLKKSFRWLKDRCTQVVYGWR